MSCNKSHSENRYSFVIDFRGLVQPAVSRKTSQTKLTVVVVVVMKNVNSMTVTQCHIVPNANTGINQRLVAQVRKGTQHMKQKVKVDTCTAAISARHLHSVILNNL